MQTYLDKIKSGDEATRRGYKETAEELVRYYTHIHSQGTKLSNAMWMLWAFSFSVMCELRDFE